MYIITHVTANDWLSLLDSLLFITNSINFLLGKSNPRNLQDKIFFKKILSLELRWEGGKISYLLVLTVKCKNTGLIFLLLNSGSQFLDLTCSIELADTHTKICGHLFNLLHNASLLKPTWEIAGNRDEKKRRKLIICVC